MVWLINVDGTLALRGDRHPQDWARMGEDEPNWPVIAIARALVSAGHQVRYISGREEPARHPTVSWLRRHIAAATTPGHLWMRASGDTRPGLEVKRELYGQHAAHLDVEGVLEHRASAVRMWRDELGLTVLQCADGN